MATDPGFVHLHVHSAFSLLEGALPLGRLAEYAKADHQPALALTDTDNMFGALEFSDKMAGAGIQPIIGCALALDFSDQDSGARTGTGPMPERQRIEATSQPLGVDRPGRGAHSYGVAGLERGRRDDVDLRDVDHLGGPAG